MDAKLTLQDAEKLQAALAVGNAQPYIWTDPADVRGHGCRAGTGKVRNRFVLHSAIELTATLRNRNRCLTTGCGIQKLACWQGTGNG